MLEPVAADALQREQLDSPASRAQNRLLNGTEVLAKAGDLVVPALTFAAPESDHRDRAASAVAICAGVAVASTGTPSATAFTIRFAFLAKFHLFGSTGSSSRSNAVSVRSMLFKSNSISPPRVIVSIGSDVLTARRSIKPAGGPEPADALEFGFLLAHQLGRLDVDGILEHEHVVMKIPCVNAEIFASDGHHIGGVHESDNFLPHPVALDTLQQKMIVEIVDHQRPRFPHCAKRSKRSDLLTDIDVALRAFVHRHAMAGRLQKLTELPRPQSRACGCDIAECVKSEAQDS